MALSLLFEMSACKSVNPCPEMMLSDIDLQNLKKWKSNLKVFLILRFNSYLRSRNDSASSENSDR